MTDYVIDWTTLAQNLRAAGLPPAQVDTRIGAWRGFTAKIAAGASHEPKFSQAMKLLDLHVALCGEEKTGELMK
jgi:hypothetical protein